MSISAVAVGWSGYLNKLLDNLFGVHLPHALTAAPWGETPGIVNLPAMILITMCALLLIRGASESAAVNTVMVIIKLGVLALFNGGGRIFWAWVWNFGKNLQPKLIRFLQNFGICFT